jgi:hypothetical protein
VRSAAEASRPERQAVVSARPAVAFALLITSLVASVGIAEVGFRLLGYRPWGYAGLRREEPALVSPDPALGWVNKPGRYLLPPHLEGGQQIEVTILQDGSRATGTARADHGERIVFLGCSVTFGYGLSDADTFAWKLQGTHPDLHIVNFGTPAYGTFQSLLRMERVLAEPSPARLLLYGFISPHEPRNVATYNWLRGLKQHSRRGHVAPPSVTLGVGGGLVRHPLESFSVWPFADHLVTLRMVDDAYMHFRTYGREADGPEATKRLLIEMVSLARKHSTPFAVVFLVAPKEKREEYLEFFQKNDVPFIDCIQPLTKESEIPGEGHPNADVNSHWAHCISDRLPELLAGGVSVGSGSP